MIKAVYDQVIVKVIYKETIGESTIIIPDTHGLKQNVKSYYGEVMSVGPNCKNGLKIGDKLAFPRNEGFKVIGRDGNEFIALREKWQVAKI